MAEPLDRFWSAMEAIDPVLTPDGWRAIPVESFDALVGSAYLVSGDPVDRVRCPLCPDAHFETVLARTRPDGTVEHFIRCPRDMRVRVQPADRITYRVDVLAVARAVARTAGLTGEIRSVVSDRVIDCGHRIEIGARIDVLLARGLGRHDASSVITGIPRSPVHRLLLVPGVVPDPSLWGTDAPAVLPLRSMVSLMEGVFSVDPLVIRRTLQRIVRDGALSPHLFTRKAEFWELRFDGGDIRHLKDSVGLTYLSQLLAEPHRWLASIELLEGQTGIDARGAMRSTGPTLDQRTKTEARAELAELLERRDLAAKQGGLTYPLDSQIEALTSELEKSSGLGGRDRDNGDIERARKSVSTAIGRDIDRISGALPELGRHLRAFVHMGRLCRYAPDGEFEWLI